jgi:hypothetical protein
VNASDGGIQRTRRPKWQSDRGSRAAVRRRSEPTRLSSGSDDNVGGFPARSAASGASNQTEREQRPKLDVENAVVSILQCALDAASLDVA